MTEEQAIAFAPKLPTGWLAKAEAKLKALQLEYSAGMISKVKTGKAQNQTIEDVLFEIAAEETQRLRTLSARIANL